MKKESTSFLKDELVFPCLDNFHTEVIFDHINNQLTINIYSHDELQEFKQYWEREREVFSLNKKMEKVPNYEILHIFVVNQIKSFLYQIKILEIF